jgi:hypothetical protein
MSQRLNAGLSWPGFAVSAGEPGEIVPRTKPPISGSPFRFPLRLVWPPSIAFGVGHPAISATVLRLLSVFPAAL